MKPLVSVVMPAYNAERFVGEAIASVLGQTLRDFELIVVDDGSRDGTRDILEDLARQDRRIRVHRIEPNRGAIAARNAGIALSSADLIAAMDADDICLPSRLERQVDYFNRTPTLGVLGAYVQTVDDQGRTGGIRTFPARQALMAWSMLFYNCFAHPVVMMRRRAVELARGYSPDCKGGAEDYDLFQRLNGAVRFATIPEVLLLYRTWGGNMTKLSWDRQEEDAARIVREGVRRLIGTDIPTELAIALRGLPTNAYPKTAAEISALAGLIRQMYAAFIRQTWVDRFGRNEVARDAGIKLWLLAALAAKRSPRLAAAVASQATRIRPSSFVDFGLKVWSKVRS